MVLVVRWISRERYLDFSFFLIQMKKCFKSCTLCGVFKLKFYGHGSKNVVVDRYWRPKYFNWQLWLFLFPTTTSFYMELPWCIRKGPCSKAIALISTKKTWKLCFTCRVSWDNCEQMLLISTTNSFKGCLIYVEPCKTAIKLLGNLC